MSHLGTFWLVGIGGIVGTCFRYYLGIMLDLKTGSGFPWGTWVINLSGSLILGILFNLYNKELLTEAIMVDVRCGVLWSLYDVLNLWIRNSAAISQKAIFSCIDLYDLVHILGLLMAWAGMSLPLS